MREKDMVLGREKENKFESNKKRGDVSSV